VQKHQEAGHWKDKTNKVKGYPRSTCGGPLQRPWVELLTLWTGERSQLEYLKAKTRSCEGANSADLNREVCLHSKYLYVWAGRGENEDNGDWARELKMGQLTLSMGPAGAEIRSYIQRATILRKRVIPHIKYP
jgi:hypothetical protein